MNADNPYFKEIISQIPVINLKEIVHEEIKKLLFDFGQKVVAEEYEFKYLINETVASLRNCYPNWKLNYLDECLRLGKLDRYDKGQKVTVKRLQTWLQAYNISLKDRLKNQYLDKVYSPEDNQRFAANGSRFGAVIKFRQLRKPEYDDDTWTLSKIEETDEFQNWLSRGGAKNRYNVESNIVTNVRY